MDAYDTRSEYGIPSVAAAERVTTFLRAVYGWMCVGLGVTAAVALGVAGSPRIVQTLVSLSQQRRIDFVQNISVPDSGR